MSAVRIALAILMEGSSFATKLPFITPIASLILQALTMRDARVPQISYACPVFWYVRLQEVKQYKEECETVMRKLSRVARVILNVCELCEMHNLSEEEMPTSLRAVLSSLQRFVSSVASIIPPWPLWSDDRPESWIRLSGCWRSVPRERDSKESFYVRTCWRRSSNVMGSYLTCFKHSRWAFNLFMSIWYLIST